MMDAPVYLITWKFHGDPGTVLSERIMDNTVNLSWSPAFSSFQYITGHLEEDRTSRFRAHGDIAPWGVF
jgi:hypothetical protein